MKRGITSFFRYARARHEAYLAKQRGVPKGQQSADPILNRYSFTNVFRELDRTTRWFADHVREPLRAKPEVLLATVLFRLLNRTEVGEAIFLHDSLLEESSSFYELVRAGDNPKRVRVAIKSIERAIVAFVGARGPHATGAYIISSPKGMRKLPGILSVVEKFVLTSDWRTTATGMRVGEWPLEEAWNWLKGFDYFGPFHSYEIVTDLRHTSLLERAPDVMSWANPGPGARRGLNRVHERDVGDHATSRDTMIEEMRGLLEHSLDKTLWSYPEKWEMRDVEHTLCEFDKYERARLGEGRPRGVYR
jgi:hypothetical protein